MWLDGSEGDSWKYPKLHWNDREILASKLHITIAEVTPKNHDAKHRIQIKCPEVNATDAYLATANVWNYRRAVGGAPPCFHTAPGFWIARHVLDSWPPWPGRSNRRTRWRWLGLVGLQNAATFWLDSGLSTLDKTAWITTLCFRAGIRKSTFIPVSKDTLQTFADFMKIWNMYGYQIYGAMTCTVSIYLMYVLRKTAELPWRNTSCYKEKYATHKRVSSSWCFFSVLFKRRLHWNCLF